MEFQKMVASVFPERITKICFQDENSTSRSEKVTSFLKSVIDDLGVQSAEAQALPSVITSFQKLKHTNHRCYVITNGDSQENRTPIGFLKVGKKRLYIFNTFGDWFEVEPVCVLDFYISSELQRQGYGKELFEHMLSEEGLVATDLPIDSPSPKMLAFMQKHYNQSRPIRQSNNFVVFPAFFQHVHTFAVRRRGIRDNLGLRPNLIHEPPLKKTETISSKPPTEVGRILSPNKIITTEPESQQISQGSSNETHVQLPPPTELDLIPANVGNSRRSLSVSRVKTDFERQGPASRYSKRNEVTTSWAVPAKQMSMSNSDVNALLRLGNRRVSGYDYQRAVWTNNRHTRLW